MNTIVHVNLVLKPLSSFFLSHSLSTAKFQPIFSLSLSHPFSQTLISHSHSSCLNYFVLGFFCFYFWSLNSQCSECYCHTVTTDAMIYPMLLCCRCCSTVQNAFGNSMKAKHYHGNAPYHTVPISYCVRTTNMCYSDYFSIVCVCGHTCQPCSNSSYCYQLLDDQNSYLLLLFFSLF